MNGTVTVVSSVADAFADLVAARLARKRDRPYSLFLSGGETARQSYERLARLTAPGSPDGGQSTADDAAHRVAVDWTTVDIYLGDERCVPPDDKDSNHRMIVTALLDTVGPVGSDHPMYRSGSPEEAAAAYQAEVEPLDGFDLVHLGLGPDGHCASLFPGSEALAIDDPSVLVLGQSGSDGKQSPPPDHAHPSRDRPGPDGGLHHRRTLQTGNRSPASWPVPISLRPGSPRTRCSGWSTPTRRPMPVSPGNRPPVGPVRTRGSSGKVSPMPADPGSPS